MLTVLCRFNLGKSLKSGSTAYKERAIINHFNKKGWTQCGIERVFYLQASEEDLSLSAQVQCQIKALRDIEELLTEKPWVRECFPDSFVLIGQCYNLSTSFPLDRKPTHKEEINGKEGGSPKKSLNVSPLKSATTKSAGGKPKISSPTIEITRNFTFNDSPKYPKPKPSPLRGGKISQRSESFNGRSSDDAYIARNGKYSHSNGTSSPKHTSSNGYHTNGTRNHRTTKHTPNDPMSMRVGIRSKSNTKGISLSVKDNSPTTNDVDDDASDYDSGDFFTDESDDDSSTEHVEEDSFKFQVETLTGRSTKVLRNNLKLPSFNMNPENHAREGMVV